MLKNYIIIALRNLRKYKAHSLINVLGLSLGIGGSLVIMLYLQYHRGFEKHIPDADLVFHIGTVTHVQGERQMAVGTPLLVADLIRDRYAQAGSVTMLNNEQVGEVGYMRAGVEESYGIQEGFIGIDSSFIDIFPLHFSAGSWNAFLSGPQGVLVSESVAANMFESAGNALGEEILLNQSDRVTIVGVFEDMPSQTDFPFNVLFSNHIRDFGLGRWGSVSSNHVTMVKLSVGANVDHFQDWLWTITDELIENNNQDKHLQATNLKNIHHNTEIGGVNAEAVSTGHLWSLGAIALILLLTACINFVNLSTALASQRAKEVGVRKVLGSFRRQLVGLFLAETLVITLVSMLIAFGLAEIAFIQLEEMIGLELRLRMAPIGQLVGYAVIVTTFITLVAGLYPALVLTRFKPIQALKQLNIRKATGSMGIRKSLVVLQFAISQVMILATLIVILQVRYAKDRDMGYATEARFTVDVPDPSDGKAVLLRDRVRELNGVLGTGLSQQEAASWSSWSTFMEYKSEFYQTNILIWDENYQGMHEIEMVAGEPLVVEDSVTQVLVNEKFLATLEMGDAEQVLGTTIPLWYFGNRQPLLIRGVVKDFHLSSIHKEIPPAVIAYQPKSFRELSVHAQPRQIQEVVSDIEEVWSDMYPGYIFDYSLIEETMGYFYESENQLSRLFQFFAALAIVIGCLGLYGLANFMVSRKRKEIGVRKVLGANVGQIIWLFSREYAALIVIGFVLAVPLAIYFMQGWLAAFAYQISMSWWMFALGLAIAAFVAIVAVGYRSLQAAKANPITSLRYE